MNTNKDTTENNEQSTTTTNNKTTSVELLRLSEGWYTKPLQPPFSRYNHQIETQVEAIRRPQPPVNYLDLIINTCIKATNEGKAENTISAFFHRLRQLSREADLMKSEEVKTAIAKAKNNKTKKQTKNNSTPVGLSLN